MLGPFVLWVKARCGSLEAENKVDDLRLLGSAGFRDSELP